MPTYSQIFDLSGFAKLIVSVAIDAMTAGGTLQVVIEDSMDGIHWTVALSTIPLAGPGTVRLSTSDFGRFVRARYDWGGVLPAVATFSALGLAREF